MQHFSSHLRLLCVLLACSVCAFDQLSKMQIVEAANAGLIPADITSWFRIVIAWNTGISFSMLRNVSVYMPAILTLVTSAVVLALIVWFFRAQEPPVLPALALIIGGATGNIMDRARLGAVVDFLDVHYGPHHWPAFNVADSAICIGVVLLVLSSIVSPDSDAKEGKV